MRATNLENLSELDEGAYVSLLVALAAADGNITDDEIRYIEDYAALLDYDLG